MNFYNEEIKDVLKKLNTDEKGLTEKNAQKRLEQDGPNKLTEAKKESYILKFLKQFKNLMIIILFIAAIISFFISYQNNESYLDSIIIILIVFINATLGFLEELKADKAIENLKKMQTTKVKVKRDNEIKYIASEEVVRGDIIVLEAGDKVPADARLISTNLLKVDESSLTGESVAVLKSNETLKDQTVLSEQKNMIFAGTNIVYGKCIAVVTKTGMATEIGLIAESLNQEEEKITPLQKKINGISKVLTIIISIIIAIMLFVSIIKGMELTEAFLLAISLAVAAIPEGLPAVITIILSLGMNDLAKKNAIVRKISSVETLGCTEIICTDKTGTITENKMELREICYNGILIKENEAIDSNNIFFYNLLLNNNVEKNIEEYIGDPTEVAIIKYLEKFFDVWSLKKEIKIIKEIPFDSERKMMSVVCSINNKTYFLTKGSYDSVIKCCSHIERNNKISKLNSNIRKELNELEQEESNKALRLLAFAYKEIKDDKDYKEENLIFEGFTGIMDPPRKDVKEAILLCKKAHIKPIMITGDSLNTALAIGKEIGIITNDEEAITGQELDQLTEEQLKEKVLKYQIYARVSPLNKLNIIKAWKSHKKVVAMTGDGVNDAPALKASDIGIGMGITGTEVSKGVSDIILVDDSFSTIVTAVKEGRRIFDNIRNVITYLLIGNITEIIVVFMGLLFGYTIFLPIQLLFINLITDSIPAISLAFEQASSDIMNREVRKKDSFFTPFLVSKLLVSSILKSIGILFIYFLNLKIATPEIAETTAFLTLMALELCFAYSCKNIKEPVLNKNLFNNKALNICTLILMLIGIIIFITPLRELFNLVPIHLTEILYSLMIVLILIIIDELLKPILSKKFKDE